MAKFTILVSIGELARTAATSSQEARREQMRSLVGSSGWPHGGLLITSVDAESGESRVWTAADGIPAYLAVAASTAVPGQWYPKPPRAL
ncbi:hypothetical protein [Nocardia sp. NPDC050710]|uniref:hypothetical protein n=1 Tax=Nocardia sp. NPDC050710 TaxID=3157220 RepID=UPI0033DFF0C4